MSGRPLVTAWLIVSLSLLVSGCGYDLQVDKSAPSPDGRVVADSYILAGGGAAGWEATRVRLRSAAEPFRDDGQYSVELISGAVLELKWRDSSNLEITCAAQNVFKRSEATWKSVFIHTDCPLWRNSNP